jgi:hypothetical protein
VGLSILSVANSMGRMSGMPVPNITPILGITHTNTNTNTNNTHTNTNTHNTNTNTNINTNRILQGCYC